VVAGDTLWDISKLFLKSPWRWPELWGMNRDQITNPHLIYPGQQLFLVKRDGRARLELAQNVANGGVSGDAVKLKPRMRISSLASAPITSIPMHLIEPFLTDAILFDTDALAAAPRVVAIQEGHVVAGSGDLAYARGDFAGANDFLVFRTTKPLRDPTTGEVLGYEAPYVGTAEMTAPEQQNTNAEGKAEPIPATLKIKVARQEVNVGDRLSPRPQRNFISYVPHSPAQPMVGQIAGIYGEALQAGQNQIVALNRGLQDGVERGHVFALWRDGRRMRDRSGEKPEDIKLPNERIGMLFVFQVYKRVSYALIVSTTDTARTGDRFTQP
jgi:hypothetical protein